MGAILRGYFITLLLMIIFGAVLYIAGEFSGKVLYIAPFTWTVVYVIPVIGAIVTGWHTRRGKGFIGGLQYGLLVYLTVMLFFIWFFPALLSFKLTALMFIYLLIVPTLISGFSYDLKRLRPARTENKS